MVSNSKMPHFKFNCFSFRFNPSIGLKISSIGEIVIIVSVNIQIQGLVAIAQILSILSKKVVFLTKIIGIKLEVLFSKMMGLTKLMLSRPLRF